MAYLPGLEGGSAIADIIAGDVNPSGKLPITYPRYPNDLTLYDHKVNEVVKEIREASPYNPQFEFGIGLSYTNFTYSNLQLSKDKISQGDALEVRVHVKNTGDRAGKEVVQLYLSDLYASITPYAKRLKGFQKIELEPGESKQVTFILNESDFAFIGLANKPVVEPGEFKVSVGGMSRNFILE